MATSIPVFSTKKQDSKVNLPEAWLSSVSEKAIAQAVRVYHDRRHPGLARVKNRGEVSLTTKKMYRQKHTGNARHGAATAPIFVGGGVAHGPKGVKRTLVLTNSLKRETLKAAISYKVQAKEIGAVSVSTMKKTKDAALATTQTGANSILVALSKDNWEKAKLFRNIKGVTVSLVDNINAFEVLKNKFLLFDSNLFESEKKAEKKTVKKTTK